MEMNSFEAILIVAEVFCRPDHDLPGTCMDIITPNACCDCRDQARYALKVLGKALSTS